MHPRGAGSAEQAERRRRRAKRRASGAFACRGAAHGAKGFTLVELVVTLVIVAIVAAVAIPRFVGRGAFETRGFADRVQAIVRYAQKTAVAKRKDVFVKLNAGGVRICYTDACTAGTEVPDPVGHGDPCGAGLLCATVPGDVSLTSTESEFSFDGLGRPSIAANLTVTIGGEITRSFAVERETGYVHP